MASDEEWDRWREKRRARKSVAAAVPEGLRAPNEDDDGYDPYSDYMDALARRQDEEPSADPWR